MHQSFWIVIEPVGQLLTHSVQPSMQASGCTTLLTFSITNTTGFAGHTDAHIPQAIHVASSTIGFWGILITLFTILKNLI